MPDLDNVIKGLQCIKGDYIPCKTCEYANADMYGRRERCKMQCASDAISLLKEQKSLMGVHQTADGITFIATGDALDGEKRGILLGKAWMYEHLQKELLYKGLMTDEIRTVFRETKLE